MALGFPEKPTVSLPGLKPGQLTFWDKPAHPLLLAMTTAANSHDACGYPSARTPANRDQTPSKVELAPD